MGCVAGALHVRALAEFYGVPVILHTDHCSKALLPWFDGLLEAGPLDTTNCISLLQDALSAQVISKRGS